eukprot:15171814-Heterocapsa_arctica.AAC.1
MMGILTRTAEREAKPRSMRILGLFCPRCWARLSRAMLTTFSQQPPPAKRRQVHQTCCRPMR